MVVKTNNLEIIISKLKNVKEIREGEYQACCPAHDSKNEQSLTLKQVDDKIIIHCFAGCTPEAILQSIGLSMSDLFIKRKNTSTKEPPPQISKTYSYEDEDGKELYQVVRMVPKSFRQRHMNGGGEWTWNMEGVRRVLYHLPEVLAATGKVHLVEGEKDVDNLRATGLVATTSVAGAKSWKVEYADSLKGKNVVLIPDKDKAGYRYSRDAYLSLKDKAVSIAVIILPGDDVKDVSDWLEQGGDYKQLPTMEEPIEHLLALVESSHAEDKSDDLPQIVVNGRPLRDVTTEAISAMQAANNPPRIFERGANPVRTNRNEQNRPFIELMSEAAMRGFMDRSADYMSVREDSEGNLVYSHVHPPQDVVKDVLTVPQRRFPPLVAITPNPVIRANGTILSKPGYDAESKLYYEPEPGLKVPDIPDNPTKEQLQTAINLFIEPLCDFPFENDASEANALAVLMCPVIRPMIDGCVPLALFDKPQSGTGASLLAEVIALVATGTPAAMMAAPGDNEEWRKVITTTILSGDTILVIDNIEDVLKSAALSVLLTSRQWKGRILGRSEDILLPNILTPIGTGNNVRLDGDLPRRCVWVRMDAQTARPWMRKVVFKHPNLHEWIMQSRGAILAAILTIVRSWILAGSPQKADQDILGGYESYSRILGGILEFIGVKGFLTNLTSMYDIVDTNIPAWEAFLTAWRDILKDRAVTTAELITELNKLPDFKVALPDDYADMTIKNYQRRLGIAISSRKMARFPNGLKIEKTGETNRCAKWKVVDTNEKTPTQPPTPTQPKMSLGDFTITQDSYKNRHEMSLNESSSNQTYEKDNNTVNTIYGVGAVQDSEDSLTELKKYESCLKAPAKLENTEPCPVCGSEDIGFFDDGATGYRYCTNCYPEFSKQNFEEEEML